MKDLLAKLTQLSEDVRTPQERLAHDRLSQPDDKNGVGPGNSDEVITTVGVGGMGAGTGNSSSAVGESFPYDVDHMPGAVLPKGTGLSKPCKNCNGHGFVYAGATKTPWINPSTKEKTYKRVPCPHCNKKSVTEAYDSKRIYPDSVQGIKQFMSPAAGEVRQQWVKEIGFPAQCRIHSDPSVEGVWAVDSVKNGSRTIIYLGGYRDPWGKKRVGNDFESGSLPFKNMKNMVQSGNVSRQQLEFWLKCGNLEQGEFDSLITMLDESVDEGKTSFSKTGNNQSWSLDQQLRYIKNKLRHARSPYAMRSPEALEKWRNELQAEYDELIKQGARDIGESVSEAWGDQEEYGEEGKVFADMHNHALGRVTKFYKGGVYQGDGGNGLEKFTVVSDRLPKGWMVRFHKDNAQEVMNPREFTDLEIVSAVNEGEYDYEGDQGEINDGDFVIDTAEGSSNSEVFRMRGDMYDRRVRIEDKDGRGWNISPHRLQKVTDEQRIAEWFPNPSDSEEYADESVEEAIANKTNEGDDDDYAYYPKEARPIINSPKFTNKNTGSDDDDYAYYPKEARPTNKTNEEALESNSNAEWVNHIKSLGFVFDPMHQDRGVAHEMAWKSSDPNGEKYRALIKHFKSLGFEADRGYRYRNSRHVNLDKGSDWIQVMYEPGITRVHMLKHLTETTDESITVPGSDYTGPHSPAEEATRRQREAGPKEYDSWKKKTNEDYRKTKVIGRNGFTQVMHNPGKNLISIGHGGNMGNTEENSVKPNFDTIFGVGSFAKIRPLGKFLKDKYGNTHSDPASSYVLHVPADKFFAHVKLKEGLVKNIKRAMTGKTAYDRAGEELSKSIDASLKGDISTSMKHSRNFTRLNAVGKPKSIPTPTKEDGIAQASLAEKAPKGKGWEKTVKAMKKHKEIDNPFALAHWMKNKGYKSHKESVGEDKNGVKDYFNRQGDRAEKASQSPVFAPGAKDEYRKISQDLKGKAKKVATAGPIGKLPEDAVVEKAPPGFSHEEMMKLKHKYGVPGAFKVAWTIHNKKDESLDERKVAHSEPYNGDFTEDGWWIVGKDNQPRSGPYTRGEKIEMSKHRKYNWHYISGKKNEGKEMKNTKTVTEGVKFKVSDPSLEKILKRFPREVREFEEDGNLADDLYDALFDHYSSNGEMPYGTMKARTGDPFNWVSDRLGFELKTESPETMHEHETSGDSEVEGILDKYPYEKRQFEEHGELDDGPMYDELYDHFLHTGQMPYGVAKGKDEDPVLWIARKLEEILSGEHLDSYDDTLEVDPALELTDEGMGGDVMPGDAGGSMPSPLTTVEDTVDPETDKPILIEGFEGLVTEILSSVGLDEGIDFFFEQGKLIVIGRRTASVVVQALKADKRITATPTIASMNGEEAQIVFGSVHRPQANPKDVAQLAQVPDLEESATDGIFINGKEVDKSSISVAGVDSRDYPDFVDAYIDYACFTDGTPLNSQELDQLDSDNKDLVYDLAHEQSIDRGAAHADAMKDRAYEGKQMNKKVAEDVSLTVNANGEEDVLNVIRKLSGMPTKEVEPMAALDMEEPEMEEPEVEVEGEQYDNEPEPEVHTSTTDMINRGNDLNRPKLSYSSRPFRGDNPMAEARKLMQKYEQMLEDIKEDPVNELKVPSKLKRTLYQLNYDEQPEDVIKRNKEMPKGEADRLHKSYQGQPNQSPRGSPQDIQRRILAKRAKDSEVGQSIYSESKNKK